MLKNVRGIIWTRVLNSLFSPWQLGNTRSVISPVPTHSFLTDIRIIWVNVCKMLIIGTINSSNNDSDHYCQFGFQIGFHAIPGIADYFLFQLCCFAHSSKGSFLRLSLSQVKRPIWICQFRTKLKPKVYKKASCKNLPPGFFRGTDSRDFGFSQFAFEYLLGFPCENMHYTPAFWKF